MQCAAELAEFLDACVDILDAPSEQIAHFSAGRRMVCAQPAAGKLLDVVQRQPKRLSLLDELHLVHHRVRVPPGSRLPCAPAYSPVDAFRST